jgi:tRNA(Arg) A34 adenosine deaminase TadA
MENSILQPQREFMLAAIGAARSSTSPLPIHHIGAAIVKDGKIIVAKPNQTKETNDSTMHAEIAAIRKASGLLGTRILSGCILYSTHEPCAMCAAALIWCRLDGVVFGTTLQDMLEAQDADGNLIWASPAINITAKELLERSVPRIGIVEGFMREECMLLFPLSIHDH